MIVRTQFNDVIEDWTACDMRDMNGRLLKAVHTKEEASAFLKDHFKGFFPCDVRVEFNGCVGYIFRDK